MPNNDERISILENKIDSIINFLSSQFNFNIKKEEPIYYTFGQKFIKEDNTYMLCDYGFIDSIHYAGLIKISPANNSGNRFKEPVIINSNKGITIYEAHKLGTYKMQPIWSGENNQNWQLIYD